MEFTVVFALEQKTGLEINDGDGPSAGVDDDVLVLDVAVQDARLVTADDGLQYLEIGGLEAQSAGLKSALTLEKIFLLRGSGRLPWLEM